MLRDVAGVGADCLPEKGEVFVGFSTQKGFLSWFIRWATASPASHSFLFYLSEHFNQHMVLEVQGRGFVQVPWDEWASKNKLLALYRLARAPEDTKPAFYELGKKLGNVYDTYSLIGFLLIYVVRIWKRNLLDNKDKLVCSEMVALFLRWAHIPIRDDIDRVVPKDLWRLAIENPKDFEETYQSHHAVKKRVKVCEQGQDLLAPKCQ